MDQRTRKLVGIYLALIVLLCIPICGTFFGWWHFPQPVGNYVLVIEGGPALLGVAVQEITGLRQWSEHKAGPILACLVVFIYWALLLLPGLLWKLKQKKGMLWLQIALAVIHVAGGVLFLVAVQTLD